jgi:hypothetical protein
MYSILLSRNIDPVSQEFNEAITLDPRNPGPISDLAYTLYVTRQFRASERMYERLIDLVPDQPMLKVQKEIDFGLAVERGAEGIHFLWHGNIYLLISERQHFRIVRDWRI